MRFPSGTRNSWEVTSLLFTKSTNITQSLSMCIYNLLTSVQACHSTLFQSHKNMCLLNIRKYLLVSGIKANLIWVIFNQANQVWVIFNYMAVLENIRSNNWMQWSMLEREHEIFLLLEVKHKHLQNLLTNVCILTSNGCTLYLLFER